MKTTDSFAAKREELKERELEIYRDHVELRKRQECFSMGFIRTLSYAIEHNLIKEVLKENNLSI